MRDLTKKINHIKNKGANIVFNVGQEQMVNRDIIVNDPETRQAHSKTIVVKCVKVEVDGKYVVNGWSFVASVEHSESGNIIRAVDSELESKIPSKYRTSGTECEHCCTIRDRKDTYLIYNEEKKEFKQVGKSCLKEFTGGLDAAMCAQMAEAVRMCEDDGFGSVDNKELFGMFSGGSDEIGVQTETVKKVSYGYVKQNGYIPKETAGLIAQYIFALAKLSVTPATDAEIKEMDAWVNTINNEYGYMANAKVAWTKKNCEYRDIALVASLVSVYLKDKAKRAKAAENKNNEYVGVVGQKVTIMSPKSIRVLYTKSGSEFARYAADSYVYEIIDKDDHTFIWSSSNSDLESKKASIESIVATVKEHKEYKGTKQTVVTRGRVSLKNQPKPQEQSKDAKSSLSDFFNMLDDVKD